MNKKEYDHWYWETHKEALLKKKKTTDKIYYLKNKKKIQSQAKQYYSENKLVIQPQRKKYREKNKERQKIYMDTWLSLNKDYKRQMNKEWATNHPQEVKVSRDTFNKLHPGLMKIFRLKWAELNPIKLLEVRKIAKSKRRGMRCILLNSVFKGCHGHHINRVFVINIPSELHILHFGHNISKLDTMKTINWKAFQYLLNEMMS